MGRMGVAGLLTNERCAMEQRKTNSVHHLGEIHLRLGLRAQRYASAKQVPTQSISQRTVRLLFMNIFSHPTVHYRDFGSDRFFPSIFLGSLFEAPAG